MMETFRAVVLSAAAFLFGIALYRGFVHQPVQDFVISDWPSRGSGPGQPVIEFFDPACGFAREFHRRLLVQYEKQPFRWTTIPVAITSTGRPAAAAMCELGHAAMVYSDELSASPLQNAQHALPSAHCIKLLAAANRYFLAVTNNNASVPTVLFGGKKFEGLDEFEALVIALETSR